MEVVEELQQQLDGMDPTHEDYEETSRTLEACQDMAYAIEEGFVAVQEDESGELLFFPTTDEVEDDEISNDLEPSVA